MCWRVSKPHSLSFLTSNWTRQKKNYQTQYRATYFDKNSALTSRRANASKMVQWGSSDPRHPQNSKWILCKGQKMMQASTAEIPSTKFLQRYIYDSKHATNSRLVELSQYTLLWVSELGWFQLISSKIFLE